MKRLLLLLIFITFFINYSLNAQYKCEFELTQDNQNRINPPDCDTFIFSPSGLFTIHYDTLGVDAPNLEDLNLNGIPDYVDMVGTTIDSVKYVICDIMGYKNVPAVNEPAYPIYIDNRNNGSYAVNYGSGNSEEAPLGWSEIDNYYFASEGYYTSGIPAMQVTVAHEYFHAVQRKYRQPMMETIYFYEFSSTWIEDIIFPENNDYIYWIDPSFQTTNIENTNGYSIASYGHYLNVIVEGLNENPKIILNNQLLTWYNISFMDTWTDFISRNYFNGIDNQFYYYSDQDLMLPLSWQTNRYTSNTKHL